MKKLYFVIFMVVTLVVSVTVYGQEKQYESKEEIKVTITQMENLLSKLNDEDLNDKETKKIKSSIEHYLKEAESCLEDFTDKCYDTLSKEAQKLVAVKFKEYRDHHNKTHKK